jgi:hypothetical protein
LSCKSSIAHISSHFVFSLFNHFILFSSSSSIHFSFVLIFLLFRFVFCLLFFFLFTFPSRYFSLLLYLSFSPHSFLIYVSFLLLLTFIHSLLFSSLLFSRLFYYSSPFFYTACISFLFNSLVLFMLTRFIFFFLYHPITLPALPFRPFFLL